MVCRITVEVWLMAGAGDEPIYFAYTRVMQCHYCLDLNRSTL